MIIQNLKVAFRNLMKYKVQTLLSIASIAIGIVTLSLAFSVMTRFRLPSIMSQPFKDRAYEIHLLKAESNDTVKIDGELLRALKQDGGPRHAERIAFFNKTNFVKDAEFHLVDSTTRKGNILAQIFDPEFGEYLGLRSAITGEKIRKLKKGEAIISEKFAHELFQNSNPVGAVQTISKHPFTFPFTIIDVYKELSVYDPLPYNSYNCIQYCEEDNVMEFGNNGYVHGLTYQAFIVLMEGSTESELINDLNERLKPFNLDAKLSKALDKSEIQKIIATNILVYITGALLLLAAIIGFLRIQIQFLWMRRREISLRIVNGARRIQIFWLLISDIVVVIILSIILSVLLGYLLEDFIGSNLGFFDTYQLTIKNLWLYSTEIGVILLLICSVIAWYTINLVCNAKEGLAQNMRRSRNHLFRNTMLGVQIAICGIFVSSTFILINGGGKLLASYHTPENNAEYREYIYLDENFGFKQWDRLAEDVEKLPDLDEIVVCSIKSTTVKGFEQHLWGNTYIHYPKLFYFIDKPSVLSTLGIEVEWFNRDIDRNDCILIGEDYYSELQEKGLLENNTITYESNTKGTIEYICQPIGGIIRKMPYRDDSKFYVAINPPANKFERGLILIPKRGRGKALARSVSETIESIEPGRIEVNANGGKVMQNYRSFLNNHTDTVETVTTLGWILGIVSMIICSMSILSTIMLDTRSRRKEVAIRKINGAKSIDIYRLFGRVYIVLLVLSIIVAIPVCVMFNGFVETYVKEHSTVEGFSPLWPIVLGISIVAVLILAIVGWQTHKMLRIDPAKIIAKE